MESHFLTFMRELAINFCYTIVSVSLLIIAYYVFRMFVPKKYKK